MAAFTCAAELTLPPHPAGRQQSVYALDDVQTGRRRPVERAAITVVVNALLQQRQQPLHRRVGGVAVAPMRHGRPPRQSEAGHDLSLDHEQARLLVSAAHPTALFLYLPDTAFGAFKLDVRKSIRPVKIE